MNQKLGRLSVESIKIANAITDWKDHPDVVYREAFANLIIKECIDICHNHYSIEGIAQNIEKDIKEHFGIKDER